jgi:hypothetical protein
MAFVLVLAIAALLVMGVAIGPQPMDPWLHAVTLLLLWFGPTLLFALLAYSARRWWLSRLRDMMIDIAGPSLIRSMSPRTVLTALLPWIYGDRVEHQDVLTGLLGGAGRDPGGRDTAVSRSTVAHFRLQRIDEQSIISDLTWTHEFSGVKNNHLYVIFATFDRDIAGLVPSGRVFPLFESWIVEDEDQLEDFVPTMLENLRVGISYLDDHGACHAVEPREQRGEEVALRNFEQFVRLPESVDRKDLRILRLDLHDLADADHVVVSVESLTIRATTIASFSLGYVAWSAPHPCFVRRVTFDIGQLGRPGERLVYLVVSSTMKRAGLPLSGWRYYEDRIDVDVGAWMLPGHGITLLWRSDNGAEPQDASQAQ